MPSILLTNYYNSTPLEFVRKLLPPGFELLALEQPGQEEVIRKIPNADYLLVGGRTKIDARVLDAATRLKMIQRSGVGLDSLDLTAIRERNIPLYVNEGVNSRSVAEHTLMLILATLRKITSVNAMTKAGQWVKHDIGISCHDLYKKQVGLIGLGNIGGHVASMLQGFGAKVVYYKRHPLSQEEEKNLGVNYLSFNELLETSDIISLHCPINVETSGIIGRNEITITKKGVVFINTARGSLIDEAALLDALDKGHIAAAGLDAFHKEPLPSDHPFLAHENLVMTPHIGGITAETFEKIIDRAFGNIALFDDGKSSEITAKRVI